MKLGKLVHPIAVLLLLSTSVSSQSPDPDSAMRELLLSEPRIDCDDYVSGACKLIERYIAEDNRDSIRIVKDYVLRHCDGFDGSIRVDTLLLLKSGRTLGGTIGLPIVSNLIGSHTTYILAGCGTFSYNPLYYARFCSELNETTRLLADSLLAGATANSMNELYLLDYLGLQSEILKKLSERAFAGQSMQTFYDSTVSKLIRKSEYRRFHWSVNMGVWTPLRSENVLHPKLEFGGQVGGRNGRIGADLTMLIRVLKEPTAYQVEHNGQLENTTHFFGLLLGSDFVVEAVRIGGLKLDLFAGLALDGFDAITRDEDSKSIFEFNQSLGATLRIFYNEKRTSFFGIQARHNFVSYEGGGSDLSGNALSLNLVFGSVFDHAAKWDLTRLGYYND